VWRSLCIKTRVWRSLCIKTARKSVRARRGHMSAVADHPTMTHDHAEHDSARATDSARWASWCAQRCIDEAHVTMRHIDAQVAQANASVVLSRGRAVQRDRALQRRTMVAMVRDVVRRVHATPTRADDDAWRQRTYDEAEAYLLWLSVPQAEWWSARAIERHERGVRAWARRTLEALSTASSAHAYNDTHTPALPPDGADVAGDALPRPARRLAAAGSRT